MSPPKTKTADIGSHCITLVISPCHKRNNPAHAGLLLCEENDLLFDFNRKAVRILDTSTDWDLATDDHIFLESVEVVDAA